MEVYFKSIENKKIIARGNTKDECLQAIKEHAKSVGLVVHYFRVTSISNDEEKIDIGSHRVFYYIKKNNNH